MKTNAGKDQQPRANSDGWKNLIYQMHNKGQQGRANHRKSAVTTLPRLGS